MLAARNEPLGLGDLLPWGALVGDGVVVNKDGSFLAGWRYRGPDVDAATPSELLALARHLEQALRTLGGDWMLHTDAVRAPAPGYPAEGDFPDPVTRLIDAERREQYRAAHSSFETRCVLCATWLPPAESTARARGWLVEGAEDEGVDWHEQLARFGHRLDDLEDLLSARLEVERLGSADLLAHLHFCVSGLDHPISLAGPPCYLDFRLASQDLHGGFAPRIGDLHMAPIGVTGFPAHTVPGMLDVLQRLPVAHRFSSRWLPLEPEVAERELKRHRRNWWQKRRGLVDMVMDTFRRPGEEAPFPNKDAIKMAEDADEAMAEAASQTVGYGHYTPVLVLMAEDRSVLDDAVRRMLKELRNRGFSARREEVNALEAWLGSLPGCGRPNVRRPLVSTRNLADLLPVTSVWAGRATCPCPFFPEDSPALLWAATSGSTPFRLNLHAGDVGHTLIVGPTGAGKSTLLGMLAAQFFRYPEAQVFVFDKGYSSMPLALAAEGDHYDLAGERVDSLSFYPLAGIDDDRERVWAAEWLESLAELQGVTVGPRERGAILDALGLLAGSPSRTLTDLMLRLQDTRLREALRPYTLEGGLGSLLDAPSDGLVTGRFQVFEMTHLMELRETVVVPVLLYLFHRVEQRLDGRPTLLILDEAWTFLMHGLFAERIRTWLKELRKKNASVVFATQSLADLRRSEQRFVLYESCPTKILLPNAEAASENVSALYREIGLNEREIERLARAIPKRDYYLTAPEGRRLIDLTLGPVALAFVGAGDKESLRRVAELATTDGPSWPAAWLRERGLDDWADRLGPSV